MPSGGLDHGFKRQGVFLVPAAGIVEHRRGAPGKSRFQVGQPRPVLVTEFNQLRAGLADTPVPGYPLAPVQQDLVGQPFCIRQMADPLRIAAGDAGGGRQHQAGRSAGCDEGALVARHLGDPGTCLFQQFVDIDKALCRFRHRLQHSGVHA